MGSLRDSGGLLASKGPKRANVVGPGPPCSTMRSRLPSLPTHQSSILGIFVLLVPAGLAALAGCGGDPADSGDPAATELGDGYAGDSAASPGHPTLEIPAGSPKVLFLGDSLTAGLHLAVGDAYPAEIQRQLFADGVPFELVNAGVSGDTSKGGLERLSWLMKNAAPDLVVVALGANDGMRGVDLADTEKNLRTILQRTQDSGTATLLVGMNVPTNLGEYAVDFAEIYPRLAEELSVPLVPSFLNGVGGVPEMNLKDGMHPSSKGHVVLAENVAPHLKAQLAELSAGPSAGPRSER